MLDYCYGSTFFVWYSIAMLTGWITNITQQLFPIQFWGDCFFNHRIYVGRCPPNKIIVKYYEYNYVWTNIRVKHNEIFIFIENRWNSKKHRLKQSFSNSNSTLHTTHKLPCARINIWRDDLYHFDLKISFL